jgi:P27 family predicted phage terminase small subunit
MSRPAIDAESAKLHMRRRDIGRPSRAKNPGMVVDLPGGRPKCPPGLTDDQQTLFKQIVKMLRARRTVTKGDGPVITLYVRTFSHWSAAADYVDMHGPIVKETRYSKGGESYTVEIPNPALKLATSLASQLESLLEGMGMTGASREKVKAVKSAEKEPPMPGTVEWFKEHAAQPMAAMPEIEMEENESGTELDGGGDVSEFPDGDSGTVPPTT